jgi:hypothetical protein
VPPALPDASQADPNAAEGVLSTAKAMRVCNANLARIADAELLQVRAGWAGMLAR